MSAEGFGTLNIPKTILSRRERQRNKMVDEFRFELVDFTL
jgi:hypothetical protein